MPFEGTSPAGAEVLQQNAERCDQLRQAVPSEGRCGLLACTVQLRRKAAIIRVLDNNFRIRISWHDLFARHPPLQPTSSRLNGAVVDLLPSQHDSQTLPYQLYQWQTAGLAGTKFIYRPKFFGTVFCNHVYTRQRNSVFQVFSTWVSALSFLPGLNSSGAAVNLQQTYVFKVLFSRRRVQIAVTRTCASSTSSDVPSSDNSASG